MKPIIERVDSAEAFTNALQSFAPDVVLSDTRPLNRFSRGARILRAFVDGCVHRRHRRAERRSERRGHQGRSGGSHSQDVSEPAPSFDQRSSRRAAAAEQAHRAAGAGTQAGRGRTSDARHREAARTQRQDGRESSRRDDEAAARARCSQSGALRGRIGSYRDLFAGAGTAES